MALKSLIPPPPPGNGEDDGFEVRILDPAQVSVVPVLKEAAYAGFAAEEKEKRVVGSLLKNHCLRKRRGGLTDCALP